MSDPKSQFLSPILNTVINSSKDQIAILDCDFNYINFNSAYQIEFELIFGKKMSIGDNLSALLAHLPEESAKAKNIWGRALKGESYSIKLDFGDEKLERKFYEIQYSSIKDESGYVIGAIQVAHDLTIEGKLQQAEIFLSESEKRFRLLTERATDIISTHLPDSTFIYVSPSSEKILGYKPEELIGLKAFDFYHPDDLNEMNRNLNQLMENPESYTVTSRFRRKDGSYIWFESIGRVIMDETGNPLEIHASNRDITERKKAEQLAKEKEELLESVLNTSLSGLQVFKSIHDDKGDIVDFEWVLANDSILKTWGLEREVVIGNKLLTLFPGAKHQDIFERYVQAAKGNNQKFKQFYNQEGLNHWFILNAIQFRDGFILSSEDITKQVQSEEEIKRYNIELEEKIKTRTYELETINEINKTIAGELNLDLIVQKITDATTKLSKAEFGAFFYNLVDDKGERYTLYQIAGVPKEEFTKFPLPRNTKIFEPTFHGTKIVRSDDITKDINFGQNDPYFGMPKGHLPVKSYLAVPVISRTGEVLGGLFYGHSKAGVFTEESERIVSAISTHAALSIDNAKLFSASRASEERFRFMAESTPQMVWTTEANGDHNYFNKNWYEYTGLTFDKTSGWGWRQAVHPEEYDECVASWTNSITTGANYQVEYRLKRWDGEYRWHLGRALPMRNEKGEIVKWFGTCTDIHDTKLTQERLAENEKQLRLIINNIPAYIAYIDNNEIYRFANEKYKNIGFAEWPIDGRSVKETLGTNYENRKPVLDRVYAGEGLTSEMELELKTGTVQHVELKYLPDKDADGRVKGFLVMGVDLTERIEWQRTLERKNSELTKINADLDNFIYTASHDLKAPIANLEGLLNALKKQFEDQPVNPQIESLVGFMDKSILRFQETIKGLTEISKTQKNINDDIEVISVKGLIEDIRIEISNMLLDSGANLNVTTQGCETIGFSRYNLRSIFYNLITNAIKYRNPRNELQIDISFHCDINHCIIEVEDNGLGIKEDNLNKIFEMFKRFHNHVEGSGIGLYIVKRIVENVGGKIEVQSELGSGTKFKIILPRQIY